MCELYRQVMLVVMLEKRMQALPRCCRHRAWPGVGGTWYTSAARQTAITSKRTLA